MNYNKNWTYYLGAILASILVALIVSIGCYGIYLLFLNLICLFNLTAKASIGIVWAILSLFFIFIFLKEDHEDGESI